LWERCQKKARVRKWRRWQHKERRQLLLLPFLLQRWLRLWQPQMQGQQLQLRP
jgi:hypothetical protein